MELDAAGWTVWETAVLVFGVAAAVVAVVPLVLTRYGWLGTFYCTTTEELLPTPADEPGAEELWRWLSAEGFAAVGAHSYVIRRCGWFWSPPNRHWLFRSRDGLTVVMVCPSPEWVGAWWVEFTTVTSTGVVVRTWHEGPEAAIADDLSSCRVLPCDVQSLPGVHERHILDAVTVRGGVPVPVSLAEWSATLQRAYRCSWRRFHAQGEFTFGLFMLGVAWSLAALFLSERVTEPVFIGATALGGPLYLLLIGCYRRLRGHRPPRRRRPRPAR